MSALAQNTPPTQPPSPVAAPETPVPPAPSVTAMAADETDRRLRWIDAQLERESHPAQRWYWFFFSASMVSVFANSFVAATWSDRDARGVLPPISQQTRPGFFVGAANSFIGWLPLLLSPFGPAFASGTLRSMLPVASDAQRVARLREAERLLRESAAGEAFSHSWVVHGIGLVLAAGSSAAIWAFEQPWWTVVGNFALVVGLNELQMLLAPTGAIRAWDAYRRGDWQLGSPPRASAPGARVSIRPAWVHGGPGVVGMF